ncbi:MAG: polyphosphate polymerase domain-containing protein [Anaerolineae bacterium]
MTNAQPVSTQTPRYEVKIPCEPHRLPQIQAIVRLHPIHWRVAYPPRQVNNVYFDTADYQSLNENLSGVGTRGKLRLRWYGSGLDTVAGARLELKYREGAVGWKGIWPLDITLDLALKSWPEVCQSIREAADARASSWLAQFSYPVLINHYQRAYYVTTDQKVRLTIDTRLRAFDQRFSNRPNLRRPAVIADRIVVELKAPTDRLSYQRLVEALAHFPLRPDRHSKYVRGMLAAPDFDGVELL